MANLESLPSDLLYEILLKISSNSYADLCLAKVSSKTLNNISNEAGFLRNVDLINIILPWKWDVHGRVGAFFSRCLAAGNPSAQLRRGLSLIFFEHNLQAGCDFIQMASDNGFLMGKYCHTMLHLTMDGTSEVFNSVKALSREDAKKMRLTMEKIFMPAFNFQKPEELVEMVFQAYKKSLSTRICGCLKVPDMQWMGDEYLLETYGDQLCESCFWKLECANLWWVVPSFAMDWPRFLHQ
ncbi:uncharacterized protein LOC112083128 [Eutrema salsugineum]|uniref:uncharacterized protein LOC112083128 n=1 Tax=Eutrema salsugineum TaxID=72664 RepID=UPI000CECEB89|nr:uncharacterized protein LOC112083128 [Eutrema salsugineum]